MAYTNIDDPSAYFQTALYAGNNSTQSITNDGNSDLKPDFLWFKNRSETVSNTLWDSSRGITKFQVTNADDSYPDFTNASGYELTSFNTDGFGLGAHNNAGINQSSSYNYAAWQWKANGGTTASNSDGSITSTVQANQDAGFSIVTYAGTGVYNKTVGHGLGVTPAVVILKNRTTGEASYDDWWVYHQHLSNPVNRALRLNETGVEQSSTVFWSVLPSSTIFGVGGSVDAPRYTNGASQDYIAYCFAEKQGYSKFGSYKGNGNVDGPFVYTGFKPAWIMFKDNTNASSWRIVDSKRNPTNLVDKQLTANANSAEGTFPYVAVDFLSNGFKSRTTQAESNQSGSSYVYMAFAENPFVTSTGIPTTAR